KIWNMILIIATFTLSILGTFITRSGILGSVHSFSKSNIGPAFLFFIVVTLVFSLILLFSRQSLLASKPQKAGIFCKENSFLMNNIIFVVMAFTVLYGTVFPLLAEALANKKLSIQAPFFNTIMTPLAILMILLMGITHIMGWKKTSYEMIVKNSLVPLIIAVVVMTISVFSFETSWQFLLISGTTVFAGCIVIVEFYRSFKINRSVKGKAKSGLMKFLGTVWRDKRRRGGLIIHFGIVLMAVGVCGNFFNQETSFTLYPGEQKTMGDYTLTFNKVRFFKSGNSEHRGIELDVLDKGRNIGKLVPVKAYYPTSPQPMTEVAIRRSFIEDLYISLSSINEDGSATIIVFINPMVNFVWASMVFFFIGILFSLSYKPIQLRKLS
ncbi:heme lyase CcmF/NrfE family subunit, partial [bacterium]|nr:heme lyase CcmF/NrfE family subunit [bacterium]